MACWLQEQCISSSMYDFSGVEIKNKQRVTFQISAMVENQQLPRAQQDQMRMEVETRFDMEDHWVSYQGGKLPEPEKESPQAPRDCDRGGSQRGLIQRVGHEEDHPLRLSQDGVILISPAS